jgi:outer membrane immunogenic protein
MFRTFLLSTAAIVVLGSSAAFAADLPVRTEPPVYVPPPPIFTWTGFYIGGQVGYQWANRTGSGDILPIDGGGIFVTDPGLTPRGVVGGGHAGFNYQGIFPTWSQLVLGIEVDAEGTGVRNSAVDPSGLLQASTRIPVQGSVRGRLGLAWDRALIYATGGLAIGEIRASLTNLSTGFSDSASATRIGWTVGGGVDYAITNNWSVGAEYRYTSFGTITNVDVNGVFFGGPFDISRRMTDNAVRGRVSYLFNPPPPPPPAPIVSKY